MSDCCNQPSNFGDTPCCAPCPPPPPTLVAGSRGVAGVNGTDGTPGLNAFTYVNNVSPASFIVPAVGSTVTVSVASSLMFVVGQVVLVGDTVNTIYGGPATFQITAIPSNASITIKFLGYTGDVLAGSVISSGALVQSGGSAIFPGFPLALRYGGTGAGDGLSDAVSKPLAQASLGLGQNAVTLVQNLVTQVITGAFVQVGTVQVTIPATGEYLFLATATVDFEGCRWTAMANTLVQVYDSTAPASLVIATRPISITADVIHPENVVVIHMATVDYVLPFTVAPGTFNNVIQLRIMRDVAPAAGTLYVRGGSLCALPLRYS